jgi:hypothetical protein
MPRYRFAWKNLPRPLLRQLGQDLGLSQPVDEALRTRYGARPRPDFIKDAWPTLISAWLAKDSTSRKEVVSQLKARRLGDHAAAVGSAAAQVAYLRSCRNSTSLREVVAAAFSVVGESNSVATSVPSETTPTDNPIVSAGSVEQPADSQPGPTDDDETPPTSLRDWLGWAVAKILGVDEVTRDEDDDIPVRCGSTMCYVRSVEDPPSVRMFAPMVVEIPVTPQLLAALNDINLRINVGRVFHAPSDEVIYSLELYGEQLTVGILEASLEAATDISDHFDHELQARFGGRTLFAEMSDDAVMV